MGSAVVEQAPVSEIQPWRGGCVLALGLGFLTVATFYGTLFIVFGTPRGGVPAEEWPILLLQILIAGAPFGILALTGMRAKLPWLVAVILTVCFWGTLFFSAWIAARDQTGANIGMGLLMLASPLLITGAALLTAKFMR
jgi:ABC-type transport system involved in multi-copper enzyme maturation permease subunit